MSEPTPTTHTEGWVKFSRYQCKEGFIDHWIGDMADNPNLETQSPTVMRAFHQYFRLNGKDKWFGAYDLNPVYMDIIKNHCTDKKSIEVFWLLHGINAY